jgi:hypothetical protein
LRVVLLQILVAQLARGGDVLRVVLLPRLGLVLTFRRFRFRNVIAALDVADAVGGNDRRLAARQAF